MRYYADIRPRQVALRVIRRYLLKVLVGAFKKIERLRITAPL